MSVLVINSGSSSIKYQLVNPETGEAIASGLVERIGEDEGHIAHSYNGTTTELNDPVPDHGAGLSTVLALCEKVGPSLTDGSIDAVGHRIVQGGKYFDGPVVVDDEVEKLIELRMRAEQDEKRRNVMDMHLNIIVGQTEEYSKWLVEGLNADKKRADSSVISGEENDNEFVLAGLIFIHIPNF